MFLENYRKFIKYYGNDKKIKLACFAVLSFTAGLLELIGVALIYPFIMLIVSPNIFTGMSFYKCLTHILHTDNSTLVSLFVGGCVLGIFIAKNLFMILILCLQTRFTTYWKRDIAKIFMKYFLYAPYKDVMKISESDKMFYMSTLSSQVVDGFVVRFINLGINIIIISMIISFLLWKFPIAAIVTIVFAICSMYVQNQFFKAKTTEISKKMFEVQQRNNRILVQNIYSLKELKVLCAEKCFFDKYISSDSEMRKVQIQQFFYSSIPPYIVETFIVVSILLLGALISLQNSLDTSKLIASFAVVAAALFRIAPALNRIQTSIININSTRDFVRRIIKIYEENNLGLYNSPEIIDASPIRFEHEIQFKNINFSYDKKQVLKNINLTIKKGDFIGIIGLSGAGKTTLADILLGLLPVNSGEIYIDGLKLKAGDFCAFRQKTGYVMQDVRVIEGSFRENVAWGVESDKIDNNRVCHALRLARLYDFVMTFEDGIYANPIIGTSGMSQGQKQRLAIARALYSDPDILILDEATSALDVVVENEITEVLNDMSKNRTIIAIAHRLSTLKACNRLVYLKEGEIVDSGTFEELTARYEEFANLVKLSTISEKK